MQAWRTLFNLTLNWQGKPMLPSFTGRNTAHSFAWSCSFRGLSDAVKFAIGCLCCFCAYQYPKPKQILKDQEMLLCEFKSLKTANEGDMECNQSWWVPCFWPWSMVMDKPRWSVNYSQCSPSSLESCGFGSHNFILCAKQCRLQQNEIASFVNHVMVRSLQIAIIAYLGYAQPMAFRLNLGGWNCCLFFSHAWRRGIPLTLMLCLLPELKEGGPGSKISLFDLLVYSMYAIYWSRLFHCDGALLSSCDDALLNPSPCFSLFRNIAKEALKYNDVYFLKQTPVSWYYFWNVLCTALLGWYHLCVLQRNERFNGIGVARGGQRGHGPANFQKVWSFCAAFSQTK